MTLCLYGQNKSFMPGSFLIFFSIRGKVVVCENIPCAFKSNYLTKMKLKVYIKILTKNKNKIKSRNRKVIRKRRKFKKRTVALITLIFD